MNERERQKIIEFEAKKKARADKSAEKARKLHEQLLAMKEKSETKRKKKAAEEFQGYYYDPNRRKYRVQFSYGGIRYRGGSYPTHWEAHAVYLEERAKVEAKAKQEYEAFQKEINERNVRIQAELKAKKEAEEAEDYEIFFPEDSEHDGDYEGDDDPDSDLAPSQKTP